MGEPKGQGGENRAVVCLSPRSLQLPGFQPPPRPAATCTLPACSTPAALLPPACPRVCPLPSAARHPTCTRPRMKSRYEMPPICSLAQPATLRGGGGGGGGASGQRGAPGVGPGRFAHAWRMLGPPARTGPRSGRPGTLQPARPPARPPASPPVLTCAARRGGSPQSCGLRPRCPPPCCSWSQAPSAASGGQAGQGQRSGVRERMRAARMRATHSSATTSAGLLLNCADTAVETSTPCPQPLQPGTQARGCCCSAHMGWLLRVGPAPA